MDSLVFLVSDFTGVSVMATKLGLVFGGGTVLCMVVSKKLADFL